MPSKALRFCAHAGCDELVTGRYCDEHQEQHEQRERDEKARYDKTRQPASKRGYDATWAEVRKAYLRRHPLCEECERQGKVKPAVLVHHKIPLSEGGARLDTSNLAAMCRRCHEDVHGGERFRRRG